MKLPGAGRRSLSERNPFSDIRDLRGGSDTRLPFSEEDLRALFGSPIHTGQERPDGCAGEAGYWLPLMGLYTGARRDELCTLRLADIGTRGSPGENEDAIHFIDINNRGEGKSVKNKSSIRQVPLHPELMRLGFMSFVEWRRAKDTFSLLTSIQNQTVARDSSVEYMASQGGREDSCSGLGFDLARARRS